MFTYADEGKLSCVHVFKYCVLGPRADSLVKGIVNNYRSVPNIWTEVVFQAVYNHDQTARRSSLIMFIHCLS